MNTCFASFRFDIEAWKDYLTRVTLVRDVFENVNEWIFDAFEHLRKMARRRSCFHVEVEKAFSVSKESKFDPTPSPLFCSA